MKASNRALALIHGEEKCKLKAYKDGGSVWTIGWGHTGPEVHEGLEWTQEQADEAGLADLEDAENKVNHTVKATLAQNQFDALVSFVYNVGHVGHSMATLLNQHNFDAAASQFKLFVHDAHGNVENGLVKRRAEEEELFRAQAA
jgi:lysozyme